jgi:2-polyprenyl-3-methyl-5-hydroxy-6-metoxy-1,4-benzoquinol methylase
MNFTKCIYCGHNELEDIKEFSHAFLVKCHSCRFVFCKRIPTPEELTKHYSNYPRYTSLSPITEKRYNELLDRFESFRQNNKLIDLGCSNGLFLEVAKKRGWEVYGTEYAQESIDHCAKNGIRVFKSDQLPAEFFDLKFDVVTSFEVIEHINTPNEEIEFVNKILRSGGAFYVTTPNFNSISRSLLKSKWNIVEYPEHLSYFTPATLHKLMLNHGFQKKFISTTGISFSRFKQSIGQSEESRTKNANTDEQLRNRIEKNRFLLFAKAGINFFLNTFKMGDAMKALYTKP